MDEDKIGKVYYLVETIACALSLFFALFSGIFMLREEINGVQPSWYMVWIFWISTFAFATMLLVELGLNLMKHINKGEN